MSGGYSVDLCENFMRIGTASSFTFDGVLRMLAAGEWKLTAPLAGIDIDPAMLRSVNSIVISDADDRIVYPGILRPVSSSPGSMLRSDTPAGTMVSFDGVDLFGLLGVRQSWPTPDEVAPWSDGYDVRTGPGSTVAAQFISHNIGNDALPDRQISGLDVVDPIVGTSSTWSTRLQQLDELVATVCRDSGVTCRPRLTEDRDIEYVFASPSDMSASTLFTDQGDLLSSMRMFAVARSTHVTAAGQGELTARAFSVADSGATGIDRIESVYEASNTSTTAGLDTIAATQLQLSASSTSVEADISVAASQRIRYLHEYDLGDWVGIQVDGERDSAQVESVSFSLTADNSKVIPVLGRQTSNAAVELIRDVEDLQSRFGRSIS